MKAIVLTLKVTYLRLWAKYYQNQFQKYTERKNFLKLIVLADSMKYQNCYESAKELQEYYSEKLTNCMEKLRCVKRDLILIQ